MSSQTFSVRSNAIRNARSKLGKAAQQGVDFIVTKHEDTGHFSWSPIAASLTTEAVESGAPTGEGVAIVDAPEMVTETVAKVAKPLTKTERRVRSASKADASKSRKSVAKKAKKAKAKKAKVTSAVAKYIRKRVNGANDLSGKRRQLINEICHPNGASLDVLVEHLGWQKHTIRGAISTAKDQGLIKDLDSSKHETRGRVYRATKVMSEKPAVVEEAA